MKQGCELIEDINGCAVPAGAGAFWWLGQHSFVVKLCDRVIYVDPFLSPLEGRRTAPLLAPEQITNADLVLGSHDHADHIDRDVWPTIAEASPSAVFVMPRLLVSSVAHDLGLPRDRVRGVDDKVSVDVDVVRVTGVPAAHEFLDPDPVSGLHPCVGFVVEAGGLTVYHAGDTCLYESIYAILRRWTFDVAFLPINGRDAKRLESGCIGNMTYQEAADLAGILKPGLTIPAHFDMFAMNSEDPALFSEYMRVKYPQLETRIPVHGERVMWQGRHAAGR